MKVLHLNTNDCSGGAARAAYRLHKGLIASGVDSYMLVQKKVSNDSTVFGPTSNVSKGMGMIRQVIYKLPLVFYKKRKKVPWSPSWLSNKNIIKKIKRINPDIIHLHWINGGFLGIEDLNKIKKPIVWTLHDMWSFTGGCHYAGNCKKYEIHCKKCPQLSSKKNRDLSYRIFKKKEKIYQNLDLNIVVLCNWMNECVKNSKLLSSNNITMIPNGLDTNVFKSIDKKYARDILNLPIDKKIICFGAMKASSDKRKGFSYLCKAMEYLVNDKIDDVLLVVFGSSYCEDIDKLPFDVIFLGKLKDEYSISLVYNASDVFVGPSLEDNLPNTFVESLACGTPCVGFDVGGIPDLIDHKKNGYLVKYKDPKDLAKGLKWCIENKERNKKLGENAKDKAKTEYSIENQAKKYAKLYSKLLNRH